MREDGRVVQTLVEHQPLELKVEGSSPSSLETLKWIGSIGGKMKCVVTVLCIATLLLTVGCHKRHMLKHRDGGCMPCVQVDTLTKVPDQNVSTNTNLNKPFNIIVGNKATVHFDYDKWELTEMARQVLVAYAKSFKGKSLLIEGHCDERGTIEYNLCLGQKRADAVQEYLKFLGVYKTKTISYGEEKPISLGHSEFDWARNRRVEIKVQ